MFKFKHYVPPLGISLLSSFIQSKGHECCLLDMRLLSGLNELKQHIDVLSPQVVGLSILTSEMENARRAIDFIHQNYPKVKIVIGGPHATILPHEVAKITGVTAVVIGEGELTLLDLLKCFKKNFSLARVKGIVYFDNKKVKINPPRKFIQNLNKLPFADRHIINSRGWNSKAYALFFPMTYPFTNLIVSRGCPGRCTMCQPTLDKIFGRPTRFRSPANVISEIKQMIKDYHIRSVIFWDDTLTANSKWLHQFCKLITKEKIQIDWWCYSRVNHINQGVIDLMKRAGCKMICFGIESGSQRVLNYVIKKGTTVQQNIDAIKLCHQNGILANANVMIGSPTETLEEVKMTDRLLSQTKPDIVWASVTSPAPGTYLGEQAKKEGLIVNSKWDDFTRGQTGKYKIKVKLDIRDIVKYQTKWHQTRFNPRLLWKKYYLTACLRLILCHLQEFHPERIFFDFIFGPLIETSRRLYWRYFFPLVN